MQPADSWWPQLEHCMSSTLTSVDAAHSLGPTAQHVSAHGGTRQVCNVHNVGCMLTCTAAPLPTTFSDVQQPSNPSTCVPCAAPAVCNASLDAALNLPSTCECQSQPSLEQSQISLQQQLATAGCLQRVSPINETGPAGITSSAAGGAPQGYKSGQQQQSQMPTGSHSSSELAAACRVMANKVHESSTLNTTTSSSSLLYNSSMQHHTISMKIPNDVSFCQAHQDIVSQLVQRLSHSNSSSSGGGGGTEKRSKDIDHTDADLSKFLCTLITPPVVIRGSIHIIISLAIPAAAAAGDGGSRIDLRDLISHLPAGSRLQSVDQITSHVDHTGKISGSGSSYDHNYNHQDSDDHSSMRSDHPGSCMKLFAQLNDHHPIMITRLKGGVWETSSHQEAAAAGGVTYGISSAACWLEPPCVLLPGADAVIAAHVESSSSSCSAVLVHGIPAAAGPAVRVVILQGSKVAMDEVVELQQQQQQQQQGLGQQQSPYPRTGGRVARIKPPSDALRPGPALVYIITAAEDTSSRGTAAAAAAAAAALPQGLLSAAAAARPVAAEVDDVSSGCVWACLPLLLVSSTAACVEMNRLFDAMCAGVQQQQVMVQMHQLQLVEQASSSNPAENVTSSSSSSSSAVLHCVHQQHWQPLLFDWHYAMHATDVSSVNNLSALARVLADNAARTTADITCIEPSTATAADHKPQVAAVTDTGSLHVQGSSSSSSILHSSKQSLYESVLTVLQAAGLNRAAHELQQQWLQTTSSNNTSRGVSQAMTTERSADLSSHHTAAVHGADAHLLLGVTVLGSNNSSSNKDISSSNDAHQAAPVHTTPPAVFSNSISSAMAAQLQLSASHTSSSSRQPSDMAPASEASPDLNISRGSVTLPGYSHLPHSPQYPGGLGSQQPASISAAGAVVSSGSDVVQSLHQSQLPTRSYINPVILQQQQQQQQQSLLPPPGYHPPYQLHAPQHSFSNQSFSIINPADLTAAAAAAGGGLVADTSYEAMHHAAQSHALMQQVPALVAGGNTQLLPDAAGTSAAATAAALGFGNSSTISAGSSRVGRTAAAPLGLSPHAFMTSSAQSNKAAAYSIINMSSSRDPSSSSSRTADLWGGELEVTPVAMRRRSLDVAPTTTTTTAAAAFGDQSRRRRSADVLMQPTALIAAPVVTAAAPVGTAPLAPTAAAAAVLSARTPPRPVMRTGVSASVYPPPTTTTAAAAAATFPVINAAAAEGVCEQHRSVNALLTNLSHATASAAHVIGSTDTNSMFFTAAGNLIGSSSSSKDPDTAAAVAAAAAVLSPITPEKDPQAAAAAHASMHDGQPVNAAAAAIMPPISDSSSRVTFAPPSQTASLPLPGKISGSSNGNTTAAAAAAANPTTSSSISPSRWHVFNTSDVEGWEVPEHYTTSTNLNSRFTTTGFNTLSSTAASTTTTTWFAIPTHSAANIWPATPRYKASPAAAAAGHLSSTNTPAALSARKQRLRRHHSSSSAALMAAAAAADPTISTPGVHRALFSSDNNTTEGVSHQPYNTASSIKKLLTPQRPPPPAAAAAAAAAGHAPDSSSKSPPRSSSSSSSQRRLMLFSPVRSSTRERKPPPAAASLKSLMNMGMQQDMAGTSTAAAVPGSSSSSSGGGAGSAGKAGITAEPSTDLRVFETTNISSSRNSSTGYAAPAVGQLLTTGHVPAATTTAAAAAPGVMHHSMTPPHPPSLMHSSSHNADLITRTPSRPSLPGISSSSSLGFMTPQRNNAQLPAAAAAGGSSTPYATPRRPMHNAPGNAPSSSSRPHPQYPISSPLAAPGKFKDWASNLASPQNKTKCTVEQTMDLLTGLDDGNARQGPGSSSSRAAVVSGHLELDSSSSDDDDWCDLRTSGSFSVRRGRAAAAAAAAIHATPSRGGYFTPMRTARPQVDLTNSIAAVGSSSRPPLLPGVHMSAAAAAALQTPGSSRRARSFTAAASPFVSSSAAGMLYRSSSALSRIDSSVFDSSDDDDDGGDDHDALAQAGKRISGAVFTKDVAALAAGLTAASNVLSRTNSNVTTTAAAAAHAGHDNTSNFSSHLMRQQSGWRLGGLAAAAVDIPPAAAAAGDGNDSSSPVHTPPDQIIPNLDSPRPPLSAVVHRTRPAMHQSVTPAAAAAAGLQQVVDFRKHQLPGQDSAESTELIGTQLYAAAGGDDDVDSDAGRVTPPLTTAGAAGAVYMTPPPAPVKPLPSVLLLPASDPLLTSEGLLGSEEQYFDVVEQRTAVY